MAMFLTSRVTSGGLQLPADLNALVREGIDFTLRQEYDRADSVFKEVVAKYPKDPIGYLYSAAVMQAKSIDYLDPLNFDAFDSLLARAETCAQAIVDNAPHSSVGYYYRGTAIGYDAYAQVDAGKWLAGIMKGLSAASDFKEAVELDSSFYDAYVGLGTYYYWKSRKAEFLNWALGDRRAEGIRLLEIAAEKGDQNRFTALSALTTIYLDSRDYELAIRCAKRALSQYPENRIFLWGLAAAQEQSGKFEDATETYRHLLTNILDARIVNPYNEILCRLNLVKAQIALRQIQNVDAQIDAILAFEHYVFPENLAKRARVKFEQAREIRAQLAHQ